MAKNDITVKILGDAKGFTDAMTEAETGLGKFSKGAILVGGALGAGLVAAGAGLLKLGEDFDSAYDSIATTTGATGEALAGLEQSFRDVLAMGPSSFDDVATAIGGLEQRLNLTGAPLETLSDQILDLSRITDTDLSANIEAVSDVMNKWGVDSDDMSGHLDQLFRASQETGISVDDLASQMSQFAAPLEALGFGFEESAALLAGFEENGINTTEVMRGLRTSLGDMAEPGETSAQALERVSEQIRTAGTDSEATALAVELFGTKAGPEMALAIREGRLELDELLGVIEGGENTIDGTAAATDDWREKLATLRNKIFVKLGPLADKVFGAVTDAATKFSDWVEKSLVPFIEEHWPAVKAGFVAFGNYMKNTFGPLVKTIFGAFQVVADRVVTWFRANWPQIRAVVVEVATIVKAQIESIVGFISGVFESIQLLIEEGWRPAWERFKEVAVEFVENTVEYLKGLGGLILQGLGNLAEILVPKGKELLSGLWQGIQTLWDSTLLPGLKALPGLILDGLSALGGLLVDKGGDLLNSLWQGIQAVWDDPILPWLKDLPGLILDALVDLTDLLLDKGGDLLGSLWDGIKGVWDDTIYPWLQDLPGTVLEAVPSLLKALLSRGRQALNGVMNGIRAVWNDTIKPWLASLGTTILTAVPSLIETLLSRGRQALNGVMNGIRGVWNDTIKPWLTSLPGTLLTAVPSLIGTLVSRGRQALNGVMNGIRAVWNDTIKPWLASLGTTILNVVPNLLNTLKQSGIDLLNGMVRGISSAAGSVGSAVANGIGDGFKRAWNAVARTINNAIPNDISITPGSVFGVSLPQVRIPLPDNPLPILHSGGWVRGRSGAEVPAILQAGEYVASRAELAGNPRADSPFRRGGGDVYNFTSLGTNMTPGEISSVIRRAKAA